MQSPATGTQTAKDFDVMRKAANPPQSRSEGSAPSCFDTVPQDCPCSADLYHVDKCTDSTLTTKTPNLATTSIPICALGMMPLPICHHISTYQMTTKDNHQVYNHHLQVNWLCQLKQSSLCPA